MLVSLYLDFMFVFMGHIITAYVNNLCKITHLYLFLQSVLGESLSDPPEEKLIAPPYVHPEEAPLRYVLQVLD